MDDPTPTDGRAQAVVARDGVEFDARDARLLRAVGRTGSVAGASSTLGRSRARDLERIETLEAAFGGLVERQRGGSGGGGSRLTATAVDLLERYERLSAAVAATARVPETVLRGSVASVDGELAVVSTPVGEVRGLHEGVDAGDEVQLRVGADAVTVLLPGADPAAGGSSARNRLRGTTLGVDPGGTVATVRVDVEGTVFRALLTTESVERLGLQAGREAAISWKATATRVAGDRP